MNKLLESAEKYLAQSDWKDLTLIKFCLFSMGVLAGAHVLEKDKKPVKIISGIVFPISLIIYWPN